MSQVFATPACPIGLKPFLQNLDDCERDEKGLRTRDEDIKGGTTSACRRRTNERGRETLSCLLILSNCACVCMCTYVYSVCVCVSELWAISHGAINIYF